MHALIALVLFWSAASRGLEPESKPPRAASWCASLLAGTTPTRGTKGRGEVMRQRIVGDRAIRAYLVRVTKSARALDQSYVAADAGHAHEVGRRWLAHARRASLTLMAMGSLAFVDAHLVQAEHTLLAWGVAGFAAWTVTKLLPPMLKAFYYDARNALLNRRAGSDSGYAVTAGNLGIRAGPEFAREVLAQLKLPAQKRHALDRTYVVALPLSLSLAADRPAQRRLPTPAEIAAALRRSGERPLPADFRRMRIDHLYYHDTRLGESVLITFVREVRYPTDWPWP